MFNFNQIISVENLFLAWEEFKSGKTRRKDVAEFALNLEDSIFKLQSDLAMGQYRHGPYRSFFVCDPKRRHIHKAGVRDRLLHHAIVRIIEPAFDRIFIYDSWSCRQIKGNHWAVTRFQQIVRKLSLNNKRNLWVLKLDIRKFFDSINPVILTKLLEKVITDSQTMELLQNIIGSFSPGLPLGNLTSQLFANVYMNQLDQFVKHELKIKGYIRYADDFALIHTDKTLLLSYIPIIEKFLRECLDLTVHPGKKILRNYRSGIDFLGYVNFPSHSVLRTKTKKRIFKKINPKNISSYLGHLSHCRSRGIKQSLILKVKKQRKAAILARKKSELF